MKRSVSIIMLCFALCVSTKQFAQADIAAARAQALNSTVNIRGVVINGSELGSVRYVEDGSAGIALYGSNLSSVQRGDSISATGTLTDYNSLAEVNPVTTFNTYTASMQPAPQVITPSQMGEPYEGELVRIDNCVFTNGGSPWAGNTSYNFTSNSQTGIVYVRTGNPLVGQIIPTGACSIVGVMSQYTTQYQLLPRDSNDIILNGSIYFTTPVTQSNFSQTGFNLSWNTNITGSTGVFYGHTPALEIGTLSGAAGISHTVSITGANAADIFYAKAFSVNGTDTAFSAIRAYATTSASSGSIKVYFDKTVDTTYSTGTNAIQLNMHIDDTLVAYINRAQHTIDFAIYSFDNTNINNISTALNNAYNRGVKIRMISDGGNVNAGAIAQMNSSIPVVQSPQGSNYTIMHNKFIIIDANSANPMEPVLWTGSTNWTDNQMSLDANNVIIFQDQSIAKGYTLEFNEMWGDTGMVPNSSNARFGQFKIDNTPHEYRIGGIRVEQYFSPSDGTNSKIVSTIATANTDLEIATMQITRSDLAYGITNRSSAGVATYVLVNDSSTTTVWSTLSSGLPVGHLAHNHVNGIMHHKYMIVDESNTASDPLVETGSHNWTTGADTKNDENIVIVHDAVIANIYYQEFHSRMIQNGGVMGVEQVANTFGDISVYPNPANEQLFINLNMVEAGVVKLEMYDVAGNLVGAQSQSCAAGNNFCSVNVESLSPGMYFLRIAGQGSAASYKVVVE